MKNRLLKAAIFFIPFAFISCDRENSRLDDLNTVTEEEAVELLQETLVSESYGVNIQIDDATGLEDGETSKQSFECGILNQREFVRSSSQGAVITFEHDIDYRFTQVCEGNMPIAYAIDFEANGSYSSLRLDSDDTITYQATLANIGNNEGPFIYSGSLLRIGTQITRIAGNTKNFDSRLALQTTGVTIDRQTRRVTGGSTEFSLTGNIGSGSTFSYEGTVTYLGNGAATIQVNGNEYDVNL